MTVLNPTRGDRRPPSSFLNLQPPPPPPSATQQQLSLFDAIIQRRSLELDTLPISYLKSIFTKLARTDSHPDMPMDPRAGNIHPVANHVAASQIRSLLEQFPCQPKEKEEYKSIISFLLTGNFHKSIDIRTDRAKMEESLGAFKHILHCIVTATHVHEMKTLEERNKNKNSVAAGNESNVNNNGVKMESESNNASAPSAMEDNNGVKMENESNNASAPSAMEDNNGVNMECESGNESGAESTSSDTVESVPHPQEPLAMDRFEQLSGDTTEEEEPMWYL